MIQLLQTGTLFIHNISSEANKLYILSSEFVSKLVSFAFDFTDEDIVESYLSFIKGVSVNVSKPQLVKFLLAHNFSLFICAMMFFRYKESMIKTASRTVLLNIIKCKRQTVNNETINAYVAESGFLFTLTNYFWDVIQTINLDLNGETRMTAKWNEFEDVLFYINDIIEQETPEINEKLVNMMIRMIFPGLLGAFTGTQKLFHCFPVPALIILAKICDVIKSNKLIQGILFALFSKQVPDCLIEIIENPPPSSPPDLLAVSFDSVIENDYYEAVQEIRNFGGNEEVYYFVLLIQGVIHNAAVDKEVLAEFGLLPSRKMRNKELLSKILQEEVKGSCGKVDFIEFLLKVLTGRRIDLPSEYLIVCHVLFELVNTGDQEVIMELVAKVNEPLIVCATDICDLINEPRAYKYVVGIFKGCFEVFEALNLSSKCPFPTFQPTRSPSQALSLHSIPENPDINSSYREKMQICLFLCKLRLSLQKEAFPKNPVQYSNSMHWMQGDFINTSSQEVFKARSNSQPVLIPEDLVSFIILSNNKEIFPLAQIQSVQSWSDLSLSYNISECSVTLSSKLKPLSHKLKFASQSDLKQVILNFKGKIQLATSQELEMIKSFFKDIIERIFN